MADATQGLDLYMAGHPKARVSIRGPQHDDPLWRLSLTDEEGDAHDFTDESLFSVLTAFDRAGLLR